MPYCTIEEAFGSPFEETDQKDFSELVPQNAYNDEQPDYSRFRKNEDKKFKRKKKNQLTWSRTLDRLPEHSGPKNRFVDQNNRKDLILQPSEEVDSFPRKELEDQVDYPSNNRAPIDTYDKELYEELEDDFNNVHTEIESEVEEEHEEHKYKLKNIANKANKNIEDKISKLLSENQKLKKYIFNELHKPIYKKDSISDIVLYVLIGIFIIYLLDIFVQLIKTLLIK